LTRDQSLGGIITSGPQFDGAIRDALQQTGRAGKVAYATFDLTPDVLKGVASGDLLAAVDQQPFLTGYTSVATLAEYLRYGVHPVGQIQTGPRLILKDSANQALDASTKGLR
jgi:simple sugar transport system substrate-binding protein